MEAVLLVIMLIALIILYNAINEAENNGKKISFKETFYLTELPIITFNHTNTKLNFLIDTGSSQSYISLQASKVIEGIERGCKISLTSAQGTEDIIGKEIDTVLTYNNNNYNITLFVNSDLDRSFADVKASKGANLHGILGSDFLNKYSYIIDFNKYIAYSK